MSRFPECHSQRTIGDDSPHCFCAHPNVHARGQLVSPEMCRLCEFRTKPPPETFRPFPPRRRGGNNEPCFYRGDHAGLTECQTCRGAVKLKTFACRHPLHTQVTLRECESCVDFEPLLRRGSVKKWAVGMTTAPRAEPTLERCLQSVIQSGWDEIHVFAEPGSVVPELPGVSVTRRGARMGVIGNWFLGLSELVQNEPEADAFFMFQDDVLLPRNARLFLEQKLWPADRIGLVSIYCPEAYVNGKPGFQRVEIQRRLLGALTVILPRAAAHWLVTQGIAEVSRTQRLASDDRGLDVLLGRLLKQQELDAFYFNPSLAMHIGTCSTLWPGVAETPKRQAKNFVGESCDLLALPKDS